MAKAKKKKAASKKAARPRNVKHEIVVRVQQPEYVTPTVQELAEPIRSEDGKKLTIPKTWMSEQQIVRVMQRTPREHVYRRKGKGGAMFDYVTGSYVEKVLNFVFGWNWDFEVVEHGREANHLWVKGRLIVRSPDGKYSITKMQFGRAEIKMLRDGKGMVDFGNDLKAASTDALKKCASLLGIASDIYGKTEYREEAGQDPREVSVASQPTVAALPPAPASDNDNASSEELWCHGASKTGCPEGNEITRQEFDYSKRIYGKPLCRSCQKEAKPIKK